MTRDAVRISTAHLIRDLLKYDFLELHIREEHEAPQAIACSDRANASQVHSSQYVIILPLRMSSFLIVHFVL